MAIPPPEDAGAFAALARLRDGWEQRLGRRLRLSMGMSADLEQAIGRRHATRCASARPFSGTADRYPEESTVPWHTQGLNLVRAGPRHHTARIHEERPMGFWKHLSIRKKLTFSILALTALLALTAGFTSGIKLSDAQDDALVTKGRSLSAVLAEAVTSSYLSDDLGTTVGSTDRSLDFVKGDQDVSLAAVVAVDQGSKAVTVKFQKKFRGEGRLDPAALAGPLGQGTLQYRRDGFVVIASPLGQEAQDPARKTYQMLVLNDAAITRVNHRNLLVMVALGLVMVALGLAASVILGNALVKPLETIQNRMRDISEGEGDLTARLDVQGADEIAQPVPAFQPVRGEHPGHRPAGGGHLHQHRLAAPCR